MRNRQTDIRWHQRFSNYQKALTQLTEAVELAQERDLSNLEKQGLIQAFEYTHELAWKTLKDFLAYRGTTGIFGSRDATRRAFQMGLIEAGNIWMDMIQSRNKTSHTYNEETVQAIATLIKTQYFVEFVSLRETLSKLQAEEEEQGEP